MRTVITSAANPLIKTIRSLDRKKTRQETGLFLAEGARLVAEAAELGVWPDILVFSGEALARPAVARLVTQAETHSVRLIQTSERLLESIARRDNPQNVIGAYRQRFTPLEQIDARAGWCVVALQAIKDPGNLGTILRTVDSVGADAVILIDDCCDPYSPEAVRASMGSIFAAPIARARFDDFMAWRQRQGGVLIGAHLKGAVPHHAAPLGAPVILLMGNEQSGLPDAMAQRCDALVKIPMRGRADSLNLAVATAVTLYDLWRRSGYDGARA